jgi:hypothetical protein
MTDAIQPTPPLVFWSFEILAGRSTEEIGEIIESLFLHGIFLPPGRNFDQASDDIGDEPVLLLFRDAAGNPWTGIANVDAAGAASRRGGIDALDGVASILCPSWPEDLWPAGDEHSHVYESHPIEGGAHEN